MPEIFQTVSEGVFSETGLSTFGRLVAYFEYLYNPFTSQHTRVAQC